jgi:hypothetical protein
MLGESHYTIVRRLSSTLDVSHTIFVDIMHRLCAIPPAIPYHNTLPLSSTIVLECAKLLDKSERQKSAQNFGTHIETRLSSSFFPFEIKHLGTLPPCT